MGVAHGYLPSVALRLLSNHQTPENPLGFELLRAGFPGKVPVDAAQAPGAESVTAGNVLVPFVLAHVWRFFEQNEAILVHRSGMNTIKYFLVLSILALPLTGRADEFCGSSGFRSNGIGKTKVVKEVRKETVRKIRGGSTTEG